MWTMGETVNPFDSDGDLVAFDATAADKIKPYLGVMDNTVYDWLGSTHDNRVGNLIAYIRGTDFVGLRPRTINGNVWKLGDIVHSTPVTVAKPADNYHIIYGDESYQEYLNEHRDREAVVYVGANDGMLHAFTSYYYDPEKGEYVKPSGREIIGEELWAYVPQSLLPHLKWLPDTRYEHTYFVDFKPKIFDAKIGKPEEVDGDPTWRTIMICGLNYGGKHIWAEGDFNDGKGVTRRDFYPTYMAMDVTDPVNPKLLWERSYSNLGMTAATPAVIRIKTDEGDRDGRWYVTFGSGPTDYDGTSDQGGYIFVVDLVTGEPVYKNPAGDWLFETNVANSFLNSPSALDYHLTNNVDSIYFGDSEGNAWHISTHYPQLPHEDAVPDTSTKNWTLHHLYEGSRPITAALGLSVDDANNVWVYFGTGRYISDADRLNEDQEYLIGIRDPYYSGLSTMMPVSIADGDLFDSSVFTVYETMYVEGGVSGGAENVESWYTLLDFARNNDDDSRNYHGWYLPLELGKPSEQIITKPSVLGGALFVPAFTPNSDVCGYGGDSNFYAVYYETGTPFYKELLPGSASSGSYSDAGGNTVTAKKFSTKVLLGGGMPPPAVGIHTGRQEGATAYLQMSTGEVIEVDVDTPLNIKSTLMNWRY
jgi:type IV pilus assembly protein PilY1